MIRTAFALLALATLAKNDVSGRSRLADACTGIVARLRRRCVEISRSALCADGVGLPVAECTCDVGNWAEISFMMSCGHQRRRNGFPPGPLNNFTDTFTKSLITSAAYWKSLVVSSTYNLDNY